MLELDHIAIAAPDLETGRAWVEQSLGVRLQPGGKHAHFGTHNLLLGLEDGLYLEVIAIDPAAAKPNVPRWFDLDRFEGAARISNWICRTDDLAGALQRLPQAGQAVELARGALRWKMAVPQDGVLPFQGGFPALMQWRGAHPAAQLFPSGCRLSDLEISHPQAGELQAAISPMISDARLHFRASQTPGIVARFQTPAGPKVLS